MSSNRKVLFKPNIANYSLNEKIAQRGSSATGHNRSFLQNSSSKSPYKANILQNSGSTKRINLRRRIPSASTKSLSKNKSMVVLSDKDRASSRNLNISVNQSFSIKSNRQPSQRILSQTKFNQDVLEIESQLTKLLKSGLNEPKSNRYTIFKSAFEAVISRNPTYANLLNKIKSAYESKMQANQESMQLKRVQKELRNWNATLAKSLDKRQQKHDRLKHLATKNVKQWRTIDKREAELDALEDAVVKIAGYKKQKECPNEPAAWSYVYEENRNYDQLLKRMTYDLKQYKKKESKVVAVISALQRRGYNIEDVIDEVADQHNPPPALDTETEPPSPNLPSESETDWEPIVTGPPPVVMKPASIPLLAMDKIEPESDSTSTYSESTVLSTH